MPIYLIPIIPTHVSAMPGWPGKRECCATIRHGAGFPKNPVIKYFAAEGREGTLPDYLSKGFLKSGFFVFRNFWGMDATRMVVKSGPKAFWHSQPDNGTFELWFNGRNLENTESVTSIWRPEGPVQILVTENQRYRDLKHRRSIFFVDGYYFVIVDELAGSLPGWSTSTSRCRKGILPVKAGTWPFQPGLRTEAI